MKLRNVWTSIPILGIDKRSVFAFDIYFSFHVYIYFNMVSRSRAAVNALMKTDFECYYTIYEEIKIKQVLLNK